MLEPDAEMNCLLPAKADPHHFELSPRQIESLRHSDILVRTSSDDAHWHGLKHANTLDIWNAQQHSNHPWLQFEAVNSMLKQLSTALNREINENTATQINQVREQWKQQLAPLAKHGVIMQHPAWDKVFESFGVPVLAVLESEHHGQEQGPRALEHALEILKQHPDAWLIGDAHHSNRTLQWLVRHADHDKQIIYLDALGACDESWFDLMHRNLELLKSAAHQ